jgi:glycerophosphoryl diester phosphodiesterase
MTVASNKPLWISHRGYKAHAAENTGAAFSAAVKMGFSALETDLRLTKDRQLVLIHDPTLSRLAGDRRRVSELLRKDIERFQLANGERFLFFDRFVQLFHNCTWTLDIKPETGTQTIAALAEWADKNNFTEKLFAQAKFLFWRAAHETQLKRRFPGARCYARRFECWRAGLSVIIGLPFIGGIKPGRTYALPAHIGRLFLFKPSVVKFFHRRNAKVIAFLPPTDFLARQAVLAGFDEILTNGSIISY